VPRILVPYQLQSTEFVPALSRAFFIGELECRNGEMNIAGVTIAELNIELSAKLKAIVAPIAGGQRHTVGSGSELERRGAGKGA
jgi:hypothetical protein